jgi:hypothetical protein
MKNLIFFLMAYVGSAFGLATYAQNQNEPVALGLPGDNLNLYAVLDVFQKSPTLEAFERAINDKDNKINNLDLNRDNVIDYIEVSSRKNGNNYSIVLQTAVNSKEYQDLAVIEVHKNKAGTVLVQIIGDKDLYGDNYVLEPSSGLAVSETPNPAYNGNQNNDQNVTVNNYYNGIYYANDWPIVSFLFSPGFSIYISPWHWAYYPTYWYPWAPVAYYNYWGYHSHYYHNNYYRRSPYIRYPNYYSSYSARRNSSPTVLSNRTAGRYQGTYAGRTYSKPAAPIAQPIRATGRSTAPTTRSITPATGQTAPSRSATQQGRPLRSAPAPAVNRPATGTVGQKAPSAGQSQNARPPAATSSQSARPAAPATQAVPAVKQSYPSRQSMPVMRPMIPGVRPSMSQGRSAMPMQSSRPNPQSSRPSGRR